MREPRRKAGRAVFSRGDAPVQPDRRIGLHAHPAGRALFQAVRRLQSEPDPVPHRRRHAHAQHAADHRRGAARLQQPAQACRRDRHARRHQRRTAGGRLRARLSAARIRAVRRQPRRKPPPLHRGAGTDQALLSDENVSAKGEFHSFSNVTSLPRPTQRPHPPFWIAATNTPETFAFAGTQGCKVMAIPLEPDKMRSLIGTYREAWKKAGHPGNGHVMNTFFMCCMPTRAEAMQFGLAGANQHLKGLADAAKEWLTGASTKDYPGYDKLIAHVMSDTAERQVAAGSAFIGTPADIVEMIHAYNDKVGGIDSVSLHFTPGNMPVE